MLLNQNKNNANIIDEKYKKYKKIDALKTQPKGEKISRFKSTIETIKNYKTGDLVKHNKFGIGEILENNDEKCIVNFKNFGKKTLLLRFAKLKLLK